VGAVPRDRIFSSRVACIWRWNAVISVDQGRWPEAIRPHHIYIKEVMVACRAIIRRVENVTVKLHVVLGEDNYAAACALRRGWSPNGIADEEIGRLWFYLNKNGHELSVCSIASVDNVADSPSRGEDLDDARTRRSWSILTAWRCGYRISRGETVDEPEEVIDVDQYS